SIHARGPSRGLLRTKRKRNRSNRGRRSASAAHSDLEGSAGGFGLHHVARSGNRGGKEPAMARPEHNRNGEPDSDRKARSSQGRSTVQAALRKLPRRKW